MLPDQRAPGPGSRRIRSAPRPGVFLRRHDDADLLHACLFRPLPCSRPRLFADTDGGTAMTQRVTETATATISASTWRSRSSSSSTPLRDDEATLRESRAAAASEHRGARVSSTISRPRRRGHAAPRDHPVPVRAPAPAAATCSRRAVRDAGVVEVPAAPGRNGIGAAAAARGCRRDHRHRRRAARPAIHERRDARLRLSQRQCARSGRMQRNVIIIPMIEERGVVGEERARTPRRISIRTPTARRASA